MTTNIQQEKLQDIYAALVSLLKKEGNSDFSISLLCQKAGVSRAFFYKHFQTFDDVFVQAETQNILSYLRTLPHKYKYLFSTTMSSYFKFLRSNRDVYLNLVNAGKETVLKKTFRQTFIYLVKNDMLKISPNGKARQKYWSVFLSGGVVNAAVQWLEGGCIESPEQMSKLLTFL